MNPGRLLVFEGLDGSGKSTQLALLAGALEARHAPLITREPTDGPWGRRIREMARSGQRVAPEEELRWFVEDRREHVERVLRPALAAGRLVLSDRYFLSTVAYQGARGLDWREILRACEERFPLPDLALLFEVTPEVGLHRVRTRAGTHEPAFERADYLTRVAEIFAAIDRDYVVRVDGSAAAQAVRRSVEARLARTAPVSGTRGP